MRKRHLMLSLASLGSLVLVTSLALPATAAVRPGSARHAQSSAITVTGMVTTSGKADAGTVVLIHAWPDQAVVQALKIGQKVPWTLVGTTTTDASGHYSVSLPIAKLAPEATSGVVNLEADSKSGGAMFPAVINKNAGDSYMATTDPVANLSGLPPCDGAGWNYYKSMKKHWATVGQSYVPTTHATQQFTYTQGQFSTIGVGTSGSGGAGSFSANGSYAWSATGASSNQGSWPKYGDRRSVFYRTQFHFGEYVCSEFNRRFYMEHVNGYAGGGHIQKPSSVPTTPKRYCENYVSGFTFHSNNSTAQTWRRSLGIHAGLDFEASVVTGYDGSAQITYKFSRSRDVCGVHSLPGGNPRQMVVRQ